ncbi:MAG: hypothetical protein WD872_13155 [Pirellulaceae bacterium]
MTLERFVETLNLQPFRPFTIHLADGKTVPVASREFVASSPVGRTVVVFDPEGRMNILDLLLVTKLEIESPSASRRKKR